MSLVFEIKQIAERLEISEREICSVLGMPSVEEDEVRAVLDLAVSVEDALKLYIDERVVPGSKLEAEVIAKFECIVANILAKTGKFWEVIALLEDIPPDMDKIRTAVLEKALRVATESSHFVAVYNAAFPGTEPWKEAIRLAVATIRPE